MGNTSFIDVQAIQSIMDDFYRLTNIGVAIMDLQGKVLAATGWQDICSKFHRVHPATLQNCVESDTLLSRGVKPGKFKLYQCKNHMWDIATPIMAGGKHVGNLFLGQFLFEEEAPDYETFRIQAREYGFDEREYLDALDRVPRWSRETVDAVMSFYAGFANMVSSLGHANIMLLQNSLERERLLDSLSRSEELYRTLVEVNASTIKDEDGNPTAIVAVVRDIAERKKAEEALRESEARLRAIAEAARDAILLIDGDANICQWNPAAERMFGYKADEVIGRSESIIVSEGYRQQYTEAMRVLLETGDAIITGGKPTEIIVRRKDGTEFPIEATTSSFEVGGKRYAEAIMRDISERKAAEEALQKKEHQLSLIFDNVTESMFDLSVEPDDRYRFLTVNDAFLRATGLLANQVVGKYVNEVIPEPSLTLVLAEYKQAIQENATVRWEEVTDYPAGRKYGDVAVTPIFDSSGCCTNLLGSVHDITERKRVDALIARLNLLKENLLGTGSLDVKLKLITDEVVESFGADFARIWTIGEGDLCEEGCLHAMAKEVQHLCRDRTRCLHLAVSSGRYTHIDGGHRRVPLGCYKVGRVGSGEEPSFITNEVTIDPRVHDREWAGALGLVSFAGYRLLSREGGPIGVLALFSKMAIAASEEIILEDLANTVSQVIQRGVAEEALRESEVRFRTVADFNYDWETWRGPDGTYVYVSPSCERVSGYRPEEFMADPELFVHLVHPDDREAVISHFEEELTSQHALHLEFRIIDREGSEHWIGHTCQPVHKEDGTPLGPRASNRDITERKETEAELGKHRENLEDLIKERTAELEKLNARLRVEISEREMAEKELLRLNEELDAYARTVSHELRTPLAGIWLALEYLERISGELSTERFEEEARDTVLKAKSTVKKADEQVKRLLELAEAGQVPTNVSDVDVSEIVGEVLFDIEEERSRSGARVELNGDLGLIRANPTHIHQLFSNLIVNAVRHCDSREPRIDIALLGQESGTGRRYLVRDNGSGIPSELIDQLFSPFVKREGGGTGTGLAIVEKIVKIYNGSIRAYNDNGACFEFVLYDYQRSGVPNVRI